jgi:hypothetical protein
LGPALDAEGLQRLTDALVDRMWRNIELASDFLRGEMLIDEAKAIELTGSQTRDSLLYLRVDR